MCRVDANGAVIEGKWDVTPAYHIHTELHRRRPDARVVIHNHPYYVTVLAAVGVLPMIAHQTGSLYDDDLSLVDEYDGEINDASSVGVSPTRSATATTSSSPATASSPPPTRSNSRSTAQPRSTGSAGWRTTSCCSARTHCRSRRAFESRCRRRSSSERPVSTGPAPCASCSGPTSTFSTEDFHTPKFAAA